MDNPVHKFWLKPSLPVSWNFKADSNSFFFENLTFQTFHERKTFQSFQLLYELIQHVFMSVP